MKKIVISLFLLFLLPCKQSLFAEKILLFTPSHYGNYHFSAMRTNHSFIETGYINQFSPYYYLEKDKPYPVISTRFAFDMPIVSVEKHKHRWAIILPVQNTLITDMYEKQSAPILNNDYIFGVAVKYVKPLPYRHLSNIGMRITPFFHESTHIGDEFALHGPHKVANYKRINVSYESWEVYFLLNDPDTTQKNCFSVGFGASGLLQPNKGYYAFDSLEVTNQSIFPSERYMEYQLSFQWQRNKGFLCSERWRNIISAEINNRVQYNYMAQEKEARIWSVNGLFGYQYNASAGNPLIHKTGFYLRGYYGMNPHGMFRSHNNYSFIGISTLFSLN